MTRKKVAIVVVVFLLAVGLAEYWWLYGRDTSKQTSQSASTTASQSETPPMTSERARALETLLSSGNKEEQAKAFVPELRQGEWKPDGIVPPGVSIRIDEGSFRMDSTGALVDVIASGTQSGSFTARLAYEENTWLIVETTTK